MKTNDAKLLAFLADEHKRYDADIKPLMPNFSDVGIDDAEDDYRTFDDARNEFLESLWDVIGQHFDDVKADAATMKRFEFTITLSGVGNCSDGGWTDAVNAFGDDPGIPDAENTKVFEI